MKKLVWWSFGRLVLPSIMMALLAAALRADTIRTFEVSGTAVGNSAQSRGSNCAFSGTLTADVALNALTAVAISFPELAPFNNDFGFISIGSPVLELQVHNGTPGVVLDMFFTTMPNPGTLLDLTGGTIISGGVFGPSAYAIQTGRIMPTPEPGTRFLLAPALLAVLAFGWKQRLRPAPPK